MFRPILYSIILIFFFKQTEACMGAYQSKIFPVGIDERGRILAVDVQVIRTSEFEAVQSYDLKISKPSDNPFFIFYFFVASYDSAQKVQSVIRRDTVFSTGLLYLQNLKKTYSRIYGEVIKKNSALDLFKPEYLSFCECRDTCRNAILIHDTVRSKDFIMHDKKMYSVGVIKDTSYYAFSNTGHEGMDNGSYFDISSVRIYKAKKATIIMAHLATGEDWLDENDNPVPHPPEHAANFPFRNISTGVYREPMMHHHYGFDVFVVKR